MNFTIILDVTLISILAGVGIGFVISGYWELGIVLVGIAVGFAVVRFREWRK